MSDPRIEDDLEAEWARVLAAWNEPDSHKRFLVLCDSRDRLEFAGRSYRAATSDPAKAAIAHEQIERIVGLAIARVKAVEKTEPSSGRGRLEWVALGLSAALIAAALFQILRAL